MIAVIKNYYGIYRASLLKFFFTGICVYLIHNLFFYFFNRLLNFRYELSITFAYILTAIVHFTLNRNFTFRQKTREGINYSIPRYLFLLLINYVVTIIVITLCVELLNLNPYFGIFFSTGTTVVLNFFLMNHFVFKVQK
jgi:putative flippase GtrA